MDENNQYGNAMTNPLPYGCIKMEQNLSLYQFDKILNNISHENKIGHLFIVDEKKFQTKKKKPCFLTKYIRTFLKKIKWFRPINAQYFSL